MSLRPIDLQTMLLRLSELSREQAAIHDGAVQSKAAAQADSIRKTKEADDKVDAVTVVPEEVPLVEDTKSRHDTPSRHGAAPSDTPSGEDAEMSQEKTEPEVFTDPDLGTKIDISG